MKDTVSHYVPPHSSLTSTEPQVFSNNLTMPRQRRNGSGCFNSDDHRVVARGPRRGEGFDRYLLVAAVLDAAVVEVHNTFGCVDAGNDDRVVGIGPVAGYV